MKNFKSDHTTFENNDSRHHLALNDAICPDKAGKTTGV